MESLQGFGKFLVIAGIVIIVLGLALWFFDKIPFFGRLPGDITIQRGGFTLFIPITTMLLLSLIITILINILTRR